MSPSLKSFLDLISWSEGTSTSPVTQDDGYDVIVSGVLGPARMTDYDDHPFAPQYGRAHVVVRQVPLLVSTAAGRYQLLYRWWTPYKKLLGLVDFDHEAQDAVAVQQIKERGALEHIADGDPGSAILACSNIWASFPGNAYGQFAHSLEKLIAKYQSLSATPLAASATQSVNT